MVGVVSGVAYGVTQAQGERETARTYLDVAAAAIGTAGEIADSLSALIVDIEDFNRATLVERLGQMEVDAEEIVATLNEVESPDSLTEASMFLRIAAASWRSGISETRAGLLALSANPLDEDGLTELGLGLIDLRVGDRAYGGFIAALGDVDTTLQGGPFPAISMIPPSDEALYEPRDLARRMFLSGSIAPVDDVALADLKLEPGPVGVRDGLPVVAVTADQSAQVVVSNRGNVAVTGITVRLQLVSNDGELYEAEQVVPGLEAAALSLLTFNDLPVNPGSTYRMTVSLTRTDDDEENDSQELTFIVNPDG